MASGTAKRLLASSTNSSHDLQNKTKGHGIEKVRDFLQFGAHDVLDCSQCLTFQEWSIFPFLSLSLPPSLPPSLSLSLSFSLPLPPPAAGLFLPSREVCTVVSQPVPRHLRIIHATAT